MRLALRLAPLPVAATIALAFVLFTFPGRTALALRAYELVLAAFALVLLVAAVRRAQPASRSSGFDDGLRRARSASSPLPELERMRREVVLATSTAFDVHVRLRPQVRRIAAHLLRRRGVSLDGSPDEARALLGEATWELVRADRPPPGDRNARGLGRADLRELVTSLERLA